MKTIEQLRALRKSGALTRNEAETEVHERRNLKSQMVGWLYPSILQGEIDEICDWLSINPWPVTT